MTADTAKARFSGWVRNRIPTREKLEGNRFTRPFAKRAELFRPTRRSVPRGVALGLFVGVMIPLAHFIVATVLAVFVRANIPAALIATFVGFPVIYVGLVALGYKIGSWLMHWDAATSIQPLSGAMQATQAGHFLERLTGVGIQTALGLFVIATVSSSVGFFMTGFLWRWWIATKRRRRLADAKLPGPAE